MVDFPDDLLDGDQALQVTAALTQMRGWVPAEAAIELVLHGYATSRMIAVQQAPLGSRDLHVRVVDLCPEAAAMVERVQSMIDAETGKNLLTEINRPMPNRLRKWVVTEAFLRRHEANTIKLLIRNLRVDWAAPDRPWQRSIHGKW